MASILPGFEYDIFISYRQNDNRSGWVTEFIKSLQEELAATIKEPVSIYFDANPHDGLLETHSVDKSLEGKLKCLIFIPILSQTYCDTKSFAWQHEFCAFNKLAKEDQFGRDIKLNNGNIASRILPIKIHDLDVEDKITLESETGGMVRAVEFIFKSAGVNRPLDANEDHPQDNINKTFYKDQLNKVAQSIKQLISGLRRNDQTPLEHTSIQAAGKSEERIKFSDTTSRINSNKILKVGALTLVALTILYSGFTLFMKGNSPSGIQKNKIAVLPFTNIGNPDNEYFSDGITGDIITYISKLSDLKVISRSSVVRYKNTEKDIVEIGKELGVEMILEGTVRLSENRARITANLINAVTREQIWADSYDKEIKDLFNLQTEVARDIVAALKANFSELKGRQIPTSNLEAYDLYLKANYNFVKATKEGYQLAADLAKQATVLDKEFALAFALLGDAYSLIAYYQFNDIMPLDKAREESIKAAKRSIEIDPLLSEGYSAYGYALRTHEWQWEESERQTLKGLSINPDNTSLRRRYALLLSLQGRFEESITQSGLAHELDPLGSIYNSDIARIYYYAGKVKETLEMAQYAFEVEPNYRPAMGIMATGLEYNNLKDSSVVWVSKSATRTGTDYEGLQEVFESTPRPYKEYWKHTLEQSIIDIKKKNIPSMAMAVLFMRNGDHEGALEYLQKGYEGKEGSMVYVNVEPLFNPLHSDPRFQNIIKGMGLLK